MAPDAFIDLLRQEGFGEIVTVERDADGSLDLHTHPFEAKALILSRRDQHRHARCRTHLSGR